MDTLRGSFGSDTAGDRGWEESDEDFGSVPARTRDLPPHAIGQDERRMQVRAYNHWASLLGDRMFPDIEDLDPANLPDFGPHSVLLDFSYGIDNPAVRFLGERLAQECGAQGVITRLSDVPPRSLLSRITDHYMQILANQAPIGFEAEFVNHAGIAILYRGILLPLSSNDETIDFIYGVINWKEMADQLTADELLLEIDQALEIGSEAEAEDQPGLRGTEPVTDWADSPAHEADETPLVLHTPAADFSEDFSALSAHGNAADDGIADPLMPDFSHYALGDDDEEYDEDAGEDDDDVGYSFASLADYIEAPTKKAIDLSGIEALPEEPLDGFGHDFAQDEAVFADTGADAGFETETAFAAEADISEEEEPASFAAFDAVPQVAQEAADRHAAPAWLPAGSGIAEEPVAAEMPDCEAAPGPDSAASDDTAWPAAAPAADSIAAPIADDVAADAGLYDCLAAARELARAADNTEDRSRSALYAAVSRAYDFSLAAHAAPQDYAELIEDAGLTVQDRAPMTPVVKLVFGHDYDKTRLTEYAAVLTHAHRLRLERGTLARLLTETEGGIKAIVKAERRLRREEQGKPVEDAHAVREALAAQLRALEAITLEHLDGAGPEFALVLVRRDEIGCAEILAEVPEDVALIERAVRRLAG